MSGRATARMQKQNGSPTSGVLQRKTCSCGRPVVAGGECAECRKKRLGLQRVSAPGQPLHVEARTFTDSHFSHDFSRLQAYTWAPQLSVNQPGDKFEKEADHVAAQIMRMRKPGDRHYENPLQARTLVQRQAVGGIDHLNAPPVVHNVLRAPGEPLDPSTKQFMESRFGHDFSHVRVHANERAALSAQSVAARAYTVGHNIVFGTGQYEPEKLEGQRLLAHELTHVIQQTGSRHSNSMVASNVFIHHNAAQRQIMRAQIFSSTLEICHQFLKSRVFHVSQGALRVVVNANWEGPEAGAPPSTNPAVQQFCRPGRPFSIELREEGLFFDDPWGTCDFTAGGVSSRQWTNLPDEDYTLRINTPDTGPHCCLRGNIDVFQESELSGESCTEPPPGPLEIIHTALDIAGLAPGVGAIADGANLIIYAAEGDWANAGISAAGLVPVIGDAAVVVRRGRRVVRASGETVERIGRDRLASGLREARQTERAAGEAAEDLGTSARRRGREPEVPSTRVRIPGLPRCRAGSLHCPINFLREEFADLFTERSRSDFADYVQELSDFDLNMGRSLRRSQTILTGNRMYAQYLREVSPSQWSEPFQEALARARRAGVDFREITVEGQRMRWPLDDLGNPWVVHHDPPLGWVLSESNQLWHPMPNRIHDLAHNWWRQLENSVKSRIPSNMREEILEGTFDIREFE